MLKLDRFSCSQKIWLKQDPPVLALHSCNYCCVEQGSTTLHHPHNVCLKLLHWIRGSVPPCGKVVNIRWKHLIFIYIHCSDVWRKLCNLADMLGCQAIALQSNSSKKDNWGIFSLCIFAKKVFIFGCIAAFIFHGSFVFWVTLVPPEGIQCY